MTEANGGGKPGLLGQVAFSGVKIGMASKGETAVNISLGESLYAERTEAKGGGRRKG
jgi:hypothetical protein